MNRRANNTDLNSDDIEHPPCFTDLALEITAVTTIYNCQNRYGTLPEDGGGGGDFPAIPYIKVSDPDSFNPDKNIFLNPNSDPGCC
jgi:hypothetical protein